MTETTSTQTPTTATAQTSTHAPAGIPDLRPLLLRACDVAGGLILAVEPDDLGRPTPCTEFDVRGLVDHLVMVVRRVRVVLTGGRFDQVPQVTGLRDDELVAAWSGGLVALREALPGVDLGAMVVAPFGTVPAGAAVASYVGEVVVHAWDLARATGRDDVLDGSLAQPILPAALQRIPRDGREHIPFGEVVDVPDDAPAYDRLVAWMGRDPGWVAA